MTNTSPALVPIVPRRGFSWRSLLRVRELSVLAVNIVLVAYFGFANGSFLTPDNLSNIANFLAAAAIIAAGEVFLLICGEIDLSAGMTFAFVPIVMVTLNQEGMALELALPLALICGALVGLVNGLVSQFLRLPSFITTLGTLFVIHGLTLEISGSSPQPAPTDGWIVQVFGGFKWSELIWAVLIVIVLHIVLTQTRFGMHTIATGANSIAASEAGISVRWIKIRAFILTGLLAGLAGILDGTNIAKSFDPNAGGNDIMFTAIAAAVLGGTSLIGGSGTVVGAFLGALLLSVLQDGFNIQGISATTFVIVEGVAILAAMALNVYLGRFRQRAKEQ
jgi:simple sugar transport system permease protein